MAWKSMRNRTGGTEYEEQKKRTGKIFPGPLFLFFIE